MDVSAWLCALGLEHYAELFRITDHVRQRGGNSGLAEVAAGHAATVENWVAIASVTAV